MPRLVWSSSAGEDVARLHTSLAQKSREVAQRAVKAIRNGVKELSRHPEIGRPVEDMLPEFREWIVEFGQGAYVVLYHFEVNRS